MTADCDCGTCCDPCGHLSRCIRWALTGSRAAVSVPAEDAPYIRWRPTTTTTTGGAR